MKLLNESNFIKSYIELRKLPITLTEIVFLEYILSYTNKDNEFWMSDKMIGEYLKLTEKSCTNLVSKLVKKGYIFTDTTSNQGKGYGGKTRKININTAFILSLLDTYRKPEPVQPKITTPVVEDDEPFMGIYPEQDNEYTRMFITEPVALEEIPTLESGKTWKIFDENKVRELIKIDSFLSKVIKNKFGDDEPDLHYLSGIFHYEISNSDNYMTKYRALWTA